VYQLWTTENLKALLEALGRAFANPRLEMEHNGERVRYASKYEIRKAADEIVKELRVRGELATDGENAARQKPARMLYTYKTGNP
jgi:hypothetical protein